MKWYKKAALGGGLFLATLGSGCIFRDTDQTTSAQEPQEIRASVSVPVCKYKVEPGDGIEPLFQSEMGGRFYQQPGVTAHDQFMLHGGRIGRQNVQFKFGIYPVIRLVNNVPVENYDRLWHDTGLKRGEHIMMPDLNHDGMIRSQPCNQQGTLTFDARYDRQTGAVEKTFHYNGQKIAAK